jgi:hypothetical protein
MWDLLHGWPSLVCNVMCVSQSRGGQPDMLFNSWPKHVKALLSTQLLHLMDLDAVYFDTTSLNKLWCTSASGYGLEQARNSLTVREQCERLSASAAWDTALSSEWTVESNELGGMWMEVVVDWYKVLTRHLPCLQREKERETSKRHVGEAHSVLTRAILLPQRLSCYWGKIVSLRMLTNLRLADLRLTTAQQRSTGQNLPSDLYHWGPFPHTSSWCSA